jgi:RNA polymerase sigma factor (sigma-70 family)
MSADPTAPVLRYIRSLAVEAAGVRTDQELLGRFVAHRDPAAFADLVARQGPMVFHLCRRLLRNDQDAEDAFQATFLVLARRAAAIRNQDLVACCLYGVARRVAMKAKVAAARRAARESRAVGRASDGLPGDISVAEAQEVLDQELARLPEKFRNPLVLCCLQGLARDEAAVQLGWSVSVLKSRLEQGRERLREGLCRRGLTLAGTLAMSLPGAQATAAVPAAVLETAVHTAVVVATGGAATAVVSMQSALFAREALKAMFLKRLRTLAILGLGVGLLAIGLAMYGPALAAPTKVGDKKPDPATDEAKLQGTWEVVELIKGGIKVMPTAALRGTIEFKGDGFRFVLAPDGMAEVTRTAATCSLDPERSPKAIDLVLTEGPQKGKTMLGIYESSGDELKLCLADSLTAVRPTTFEAGEGELVLFKLKRAKKQ